jgi:hypothetical protein
MHAVTDFLPIFTLFWGVQSDPVIESQTTVRTMAALNLPITAVRAQRFAAVRDLTSVNCKTIYHRLLSNQKENYISHLKLKPT